jgi:hypothetical protein
MGQISKIAVAQSFPQLLQRPGCRWIWCHVEVQQPTLAVLDQHQDIEKSESSRDRDKEIACHNFLGMVAQEGRPALITTRSTRRSLGHVLANCTWRDAQTKLQQQFVGNPLLAPERILKWPCAQ